MASSFHPPWAFQTKIHQQQRLFRTGLCAKLAPRAAGWTYRRVSTSAAGGKSLRTHRSASSSGNQVTTGSRQHLMGWGRDQLRAIWLEELGSCGIFGGFQMVGIIPFGWWVSVQCHPKLQKWTPNLITQARRYFFFWGGGGMLPVNVGEWYGRGTTPAQTSNRKLDETGDILTWAMGREIVPSIAKQWVMIGNLMRPCMWKEAGFASGHLPSVLSWFCCWLR